MERLPAEIEEAEVEHQSSGTSGSWQEPAEPPMGRMVCTEIAVSLEDITTQVIELDKEVPCSARWTYGDIDQDVDFEFKAKAIRIAEGALFLIGQGYSEDFQTGPTPMQSQKGCL